MKSFFWRIYVECLRAWQKKSKVFKYLKIFAVFFWNCWLYLWLERVSLDWSYITLDWSYIIFWHFIAFPAFASNRPDSHIYLLGTLSFSYFIIIIEQFLIKVNPKRDGSEKEYRCHHRCIKVLKGGWSKGERESQESLRDISEPRFWAFTSEV